MRAMIITLSPTTETKDDVQRFVLLIVNTQSDTSVHFDATAQCYLRRSQWVCVIDPQGFSESLV